MRGDKIILIVVLFALFSFMCYADGTDSAVNIIGAQNITTPYDIYSPTVNVSITGTGYHPDVNITLNIENSTGIFFTINLTSNSTGGFTYIWPAGPVDNYTITGFEILEPLYSASKSIEVLPPYTFAGWVYTTPNDTTLLPSNVTLLNTHNNTETYDDELFNFTLDYGREYDLLIYPENTTVCDWVIIHTIANEPHFNGPVIGIADIPINASHAKPWIVICAVNPVIESYRAVDLGMAFSSGSNRAIFKCVDWNFSAIKCPTEVWNELLNISSLATNANLSFLKGDPAFGLASKCGDGFCGGSESCASCDDDCGKCPKSRRTSTSAFSPGNTIVLDFTQKNDYQTEFSAVDNTKIVYGGREYQIKIRHYKEDMNYVEADVGDSRYVFELNKPVKIDLDKDGTLDVEITLTEFDFYSKFSVKLLEKEAAKEVLNETEQVNISVEAPLFGQVWRWNINWWNVVLVILALALISGILYYWKKEKKEEYEELGG